MPDNRDPLKTMAETLSNKGMKGACPMCGHNDWAIQQREPYSRIDTTKEEMPSFTSYKGFFQTYWMYCKNCGFAAQFIKAIIDGTPEPASEGPTG